MEVLRAGRLRRGEVGDEDGRGGAGAGGLVTESWTSCRLLRGWAS